MPEQGQLSLDLPVGTGTPRRAQFDAWRRSLPQSLATIGHFAVEGDKLRVAVPLPASVEIREPYLFPIAASYWSQGAAAIEFAKKQLGGSLSGKKIAYLFYDNPAGKEPLAILEDLAKSEGFELRTFAVPAPGVEMAAQVLDITGRFKPDFVVAHLFGRSPSVSIKELKGKGFPLSKVVSLVWGSAESDIRAAGGFGAAQGYHTMQFAGVGEEFPVIREIIDMYKAQGKRRCTSRPCATPSRPKEEPRRPARTSRTAWRRSRTSRSAGSCRR